MPSIRIRAGLSRRAWHSAVVLGVCVVVLMSLAAQAFGSPSGPAIRQGDFNVGLTGSSDATGSPILSVDNGYPGMTPMHSALRITNRGSLPATFTVKVTDLLDARPSLADVLLIRVRAASGSLLYEGGLRTLSFGPAAALAAGQDATYSIQVSWPDHGTLDGSYEGKQLSFGLRVNSEEA